MYNEMKSIVLSGLLLASFTASAADMTNSDKQLLEAYRYQVPANSWFKAKMKPKFQVQYQAKQPAVPVVPKAKSNTSVAKSLEPAPALPFWQDIPAR